MHGVKSHIPSIVLAVLCLLYSSMSVAAHGSSSMTVSPPMYKHLKRIEEQINTGKLDQAIIQSTNLLNRKTLNPYEKSLLYQMQAGIYIRKQKYDQATIIYKKLLELDALPKDNLNNIHYTLAQIFMQQGAYEKALRHFDIWSGNTPDIKSESWQFLASIYVAQEKYLEAIPPAEKAVSLAMPAKESQYQLLLGLYQRTNNNQRAIKLLGSMLEKYPEKKEYWLQLFYTLNEEGMEKQALTILDLAYVNHLLRDGDELIHLAQLHLYHQNPLRAALIIEKGLREGNINETTAHLNLLASAWFNAREYQKALKPLTQSAQMTGDGETYYQLAQAYTELNLWQKAIDTLQLALKDKTLKNTGACYLLMGIVYSELENYANAEQAFRHSLQDSQTHDEAERWILYIEELER